MALSYNLGYQESISVHPTRRQNFAGKVYLNFPNIWEWLIYRNNDFLRPLKCVQPGNGEEAAGGGGMKRGPPLVISSVDVGAVGHQELHHVQVVINAGLGKMIFLEQCWTTNNLKRLIMLSSLQKGILIFEDLSDSRFNILTQVSYSSISHLFHIFPRQHS